MKDKRNI